MNNIGFYSYNYSYFISSLKPNRVVVMIKNENTYKYSIEKQNTLPMIKYDFDIQSKWFSEKIKK